MDKLLLHKGLVIALCLFALNFWLLQLDTLFDRNVKLIRILFNHKSIAHSNDNWTHLKNVKYKDSPSSLQPEASLVALRMENHFHQRTMKRDFYKQIGLLETWMEAELHWVRRIQILSILFGSRTKGLPCKFNLGAVVRKVQQICTPLFIGRWSQTLHWFGVLRLKNEVWLQSHHAGHRSCGCGSGSDFDLWPILRLTPIHACCTIHALIELVSPELAVDDSWSCGIHWCNMSWECKHLINRWRERVVFNRMKPH